MKFIFIKKKSIITISLIIIFCTILIVLLFFNANKTIPTSSQTIISNDNLNKISSLNNGTEKIAYLTFDDGPNDNVTPIVLDILREENVKASFFVIGKYVEKYPNVVKRAYEEGHYIANHGYDHNNNNLYKSSSSFIDEVTKTDLAISNAIGVQNYCSHIFRFPNGYMAPINKNEKQQAVKLLSNMNYTYIDWNCLNNDSMKKYNKYELLQNLKTTSKNKGTLVILMHDTKDVSNSSTALKDSIEYLKSDGYTFENFYNVFSF